MAGKTRFEASLSINLQGGSVFGLHRGRREKGGGAWKSQFSISLVLGGGGGGQFALLTVRRFLLSRHLKFLRPIPAIENILSHMERQEKKFQKDAAAQWPMVEINYP